MRIEILADVKTTLGEGPLWDVDEQRLYWIDSFDGRVFRCTADGRELRAWDVPQKIGSMALRKQGGAVVSLARGFHFLDFRSGEVELIVDPEPDKPANRLNDGKVDRQGRFYAGSMDTQEAGPNGALYRLDPTCRCIGWTPASWCRTALAGARTAGPSISPTPGRARSGPMTAIQPAARSRTAAPSRAWT